MTLRYTKLLLISACTLCLPFASMRPANADSFYQSWYGVSPYNGGYYAGYAPVWYGYGVSDSSWGGSYVASYAPSNCCGGWTSQSVCDPCGCGASNVSCGSACGTCGACSAYPSSCCDACGLASCSGCGIDCASDGGSSASPSSSPQSSPAEPKPGNEKYVPPPSGSTYKQEPESEEYKAPATNNPGTTEPPGSVLPPGGQEPEDDFDFRRFDAQRPVTEPDADIEQTIQQRPGAAPAVAEPSESGEHDNRPPAEEGLQQQPENGAEVLPLGIDSQIASGPGPDRSRVRYVVRFHAPRVARVDVTPRNLWVPVEADTKIAASR
ncbi:MAG: hypothetical protein KF861_21645 [Planctomycetaceae bacterium]|nr:hypothetical protein [Planctomycetaceae bacterium]